MWWREGLKSLSFEKCEVARWSTGREETSVQSAGDSVSQCRHLLMMELTVEVAPSLLRCQVGNFQSQPRPLYKTLPEQI